MPRRAGEEKKERGGGRNPPTRRRANRGKETDPRHQTTHRRCHRRRKYLARPEDFWLGLGKASGHKPRLVLREKDRHCDRNTKSKIPNPRLFWQGLARPVA